MDDFQLKQDVLAKLDFVACVDPASIAMVLEGGVVALSGHVPTSVERETIPKNRI